MAKTSNSASIAAVTAAMTKEQPQVNFAQIVKNMPDEKVLQDILSLTKQDEPKGETWKQCLYFLIPAVIIGLF